MELPLLPSTSSWHDAQLKKEHRDNFTFTLNLCSSFSVRDEVSHLYKAAGKIVVLYILILKSLGTRRILSQTVASIPHI